MNRRDRLLRAVFGDRLGVIVFLAALLVYLSCWRIGVLINDSYTVANALVAVADGHLYLDEAVYGPGLDTPGVGSRDGQLYGRNYGQVFLSLPLLFAIEALATVADLRVALAGLWALVVLALAVLVGRERGIHDRAAYAGSALALVGFAAIVIDATPIDPSDHYLIALQLLTMLAAAGTGVVCYRLLSLAYDRRVGFVAGLGVTLATPVGFWAQFPKRHAFVACCAVAVMYFLYRSREGNGVDTRYRAAAYVPVGIAAWVSAAEGAILLLALLAVDVPTGGRSIRSLAAAATACVLASLPMFVTNLFVSGNPLEPPRVLSAGGSGSLAERGDPNDSGSGGGSSGGSSSGGGSSGDSGSGGETIDAITEIIDTALGVGDLLLGLYQRGIDMVFSETGELYHTFIRGGYLPGIAQQDAGEAIRLAFLEAMPLAAALVVVPVVAARTDLVGRVRAVVDHRGLTGFGIVDAFAVVYGTALTLIYLPRLPIHAAITVRYLLPLYPIAIYALARQPAVRRVIDERFRPLSFAYAGSLLVGGQLLVLYLWATEATRGEAVQTHALVSLVAAGLLAAWILADAFGYREDRLGAVALAFAAAAATAFVVLGALWHFAFVGPQALPFV
ncbi:hypothetical protein HWV23_13140 [Natronomonas halophila]|uniref:hypothetical protein n=1 Tax=Natronomonas halophila TaxID=2747817 RepID=UPI0015B72A88|nr:hypothetical protein [Natronomonas halophila]QLD86631.1 hypothetical protein HWV23_13140 [Natronomonas halophila]